MLLEVSVANLIENPVVVTDVTPATHNWLLTDVACICGVLVKMPLGIVNDISRYLIGETHVVYDAEPPVYEYHASTFPLFHFLYVQLLEVPTSVT